MNKMVLHKCQAENSGYNNICVTGSSTSSVRYWSKMGRLML